MKKILLAILVVVLMVGCGVGGYFIGQNIGKPKVISIEIKEGFRTEYQIGEDVDVEGGIIQVKYEDETTKYVAITKDMVSSFKSNALGVKNMLVNYEGVNCVVSYIVTGVKLTEERYLYYDSSEGDYIYVYKYGSKYEMLYYGTYTPDSSNAAQEWENLKSQDYLRAEIMEGRLFACTQTFNAADYHYYINGIGNLGNGDVTFKIISLTNWVDVSDPTQNVLEGYELYIPQA